MELSDRVRLRVDERLGPGLVARLTEGLRAPGRIVTLEGTDGAFCEGLELVAGVDVDLAAFAELLEAIARAPRPVVALVDGPALGGGCALAAAADVVLASERATFGLPEVLWGLIPAVALPVVARRIGIARARLLALGAPALDAAEALRWGLVDAVVPDGDALEPAFARLSRQLRRADPDAQAATKALAALCGTESYAATAQTRFRAIADSAPTRRRLARAAAGELPWD